MQMLPMVIEAPNPRHEQRAVTSVTLGLLYSIEPHWLKTVAIAEDTMVLENLFLIQCYFIYVIDLVLRFISNSEQVLL